MRDEIADGFERILAEACPTSQVHDIEAGADAAPLWATLEESGFLDTIVSEDMGGIGLSLSECAPLLILAGRNAVPVPLAETVMLRGLLAASGVDRPVGSITFGGKARTTNQEVLCSGVIEGARADHVLAKVGDEWRLLAREAATIRREGLEATLVWTAPDAARSTYVEPAVDPLLAEALVRALQLSGALTAVLERTLAYANDREQFGRSIGKFQAIQHQLCMMAEHGFAAGMAADIAATGPLTALDPMRVAIAKARTGEAAVEVAALAHAIHGAIGFTLEYDLHLHTRRLHAWRRAAGAEAFWQRRVGAALIARPERRTLDLLREATEFA